MNRKSWLYAVAALAVTLFLSACGGGGGGGSSAATSGTTGKYSVAYSVVNSAPTGSCPNGGITVYSGIDTNGNGVLDQSEITSTQYVCNGANGTSGLNTLVNIVPDTAETHCTYGGWIVNAGVDLDGSGTLDSSNSMGQNEVTSTSYVCNGAPGANGTNGTNGTNGSNGYNTLVNIATEPSGTCPYGGLRISSCLDVNSDKVCDTGDTILTPYDVCTGTDSAPVIESILVYPQPVITSANLVASAYDQNGDSLSYTWTIGGTFSTFGSNAAWNSPGIPGYYLLSLNVTDGTDTVSALTGVTVGSSSPWPKFRRDIQSTGYSSINTDPAAGVSKWSYTTGGSVSSSPAIGPDGAVYVGSADGYLYELSPTGLFISSAYTGTVTNSSPAVDALHNIIYVGSENGTLYAFTRVGGTTLQQKWSYTTGGAIYSSPAIAADGTVYVGATDGKLYALASSNGLKKWSCTLSTQIYSSPAIGPDGTVYIGDSNGYVYAIVPDGSCSNKWTPFKTGNAVYSTPAVSLDGTVYVGSYDHSVYAINNDGTQKWSYATNNWLYSSPAIGPDGTVYIGSADNYLYALDPDSGIVKWKSPTGGAIASSPAVASDGTVYFGSYDGYLYAVSADGSAIKWRYSTGGTVYSSPAIGADGAVYFGSYDKKVYAVK